MDENKIAKLMKNLGVSREEAIEICAEDVEIDRGAKLHELPPELEAGAKKARQAERKQGEKRKREKKENPDKLEVMNALSATLATIATNIERTSQEREVVFEYKGTKYKLTLAVPRS